MPHKVITTLFCVFFLYACGNETSKPVRIAINPWPGYEFLYLAEQTGIFKEVGLNAELIQLGSLSDAQRAYVNGYADGMASTVIEAVQSQALGAKPLKIVLVPDYSNGGDVIIAHDSIKSVKDLKGKRVGAEVSSLGIFILQRALAKNNMTLDDIEIVNVEQLAGETKMLEKEIDAFVTYPPASINILNHGDFKTIFSSAEIPKEIIDTVSVSDEALNQNPGFREKLKEVWRRALEFHRLHPEKATNIMAKREGISAKEFNAVLSDLHILTNEEQDKLFEAPYQLKSSVSDVCETLTHIKAISADCQSITKIASP